MGKITFCVPYADIIPVVEKTFHDQDDGQWELEILQTSGVSELAPQDIHTDVFIARGVTYAALKALLPNTPAVDLPVGGYDIMRAVLECRKRFQVKKVAIVGAYDMIYGASSIQEAMNIEVVTVAVRDEKEAEPIIKQLKAAGIQVVIGGVMSTRIAERLGMQTVFIQSGREAIYHSLLEAKRVGWVRRMEQERTEQFRTILDYSAEGIVAVDAKGGINLVNAAAVKIVGLSDKSLGQEADEVFPQLALGRVLITGQAEIGEIETMSGQQVAVNRVPIMIKDQTIGAVATFEPITAIQELEGKIRQKIFRRGHVAKMHFRDIMGNSAEIRNIINIAKEFSKVNSNVLILGESGTGKEIFAQSIHNASNRSNGPFVAVNCAALPETLLESELFGYADGAFTGATRGGKMGVFELAHNGTIFLDEIAEISPKLQGRLLRVLQEREIMRLGDDRIIPIDVRVIAATNRDLRKMMGEGAFRNDLYYRVDILNVVIPPLRERHQDIEIIMACFLKTYCARFAKPPKKLTAAAVQLLTSYPWPGNVRELRNVAERLVVLSRNQMIDKDDIYAVLPQTPGADSRRQALPDQPLPAATHLDQAQLLAVLAQTQYHYGKAAAMLGISRTTLWRYLKKGNR